MDDGVSAAAPVLAMDTAFSCVIYPGISFADALALGSFAIIRETGAAVRFELTRESAVRGFDRGFTAAAMGELLNRLSGNRVAEVLLWTLKDWEKRYEEVSLCEGIVLSLSADRRYLAEAEPLASLISRTIAPGVYLLQAPGTREAVEALRKAGVDIFAQHKRPDSRRRPGDLPAEEAAPERYSLYPSPAALARRRNYGLAGFPSPQTRYDAPEVLTAAPDPVACEKRESLKGQLRLVLDRMRIPKAERDELSARIDRRLVLSEAQLSGASLHYEKLEARGLDYVGKASIAKQAVASKSLVEVKWPRSGGGMEETFGIPLALEKSEGESILVISPVSQADQADISPGEPRLRGDAHTREGVLRIPLGKISLIRRIKKSIFGE
jgi:hypothetical protein